MDRRRFLQLAVGGTATIVASHRAGWGMETFKRILASVFRKADEICVTTLTAQQMLAAGYKAKVAKLYAAFKMRVEEFAWLDDYDSGPKRLLPV